MTLLRDEDYIIDVGPQGTFNRSGSYQTLPADIDAMFVRYEVRKEKRIAIFFHGGLVSETAGITAARNIAPHIENSGCAPICMVWETGLVETITTNLSKINQTKLFNRLLKILLKKISEKVTVSDPLGRGVGAAGLTDEEIITELSQPIPFQEFSRVNTAAGGRGPGSIEDLTGISLVLEAELRDELRPLVENDAGFVDAIKNTKLSVDGDGNEAGSRGIVSVAVFVEHAAKIAYRVIKRLVEKTDHGFYSTVVEEILREFYVAELGAWVWKAMKDKASEMWKSNAGKQGLNQHVGRYLLEKLISYKVKYPDTQISLIGHSAGAIAICYFLNNVAASSSPFELEHVILMAPACRTDLFEKEVINTQSRFKDIRIFTMNDEYECKDVLIPFVYTRSLLYLISGILEDEGASSDAYILGLERHIRYFSPYNIDGLKKCHEYLYSAGVQRVSFSVAVRGVAGMETEAQKHGDFDNDAATLRSIENILKQ